MSSGLVRIRGARTHHLKDLSLDLPREATTVVCGVSGSGKSSLVLDTLGAESRRRFLGTLAGLAAAARPDVDRIDGLPPAVAAGFTSRAPGPRETLGTLTDLDGGLRTLFARLATPRCPTCSRPVLATSPQGTIEALVALPEGSRVVLLAPRGRGPAALEGARRDGYARVRVRGAIARVEEVTRPPAPDDLVEAVVDRIVVRADARRRVSDSVDVAFAAGGGVLRAAVERPDDPGRATETTFADRPFCETCGVGYPPLTPRLFSPDAPAGACPTCEGLGTRPRADGDLALPRDARLRSAFARVRRALAPADRVVADRAFARARRAAGTDGRARAGDLSEAARTRLLDGDATTPGLLALLDRGGRPSARALSVATPCPACGGGRLAPYPAAAALAGRTLPQAQALDVAALRAWAQGLQIAGADGATAAPAREDLLARLAFLDDVGLSHLAAGRAAATLSGGERRRARLAAACAARMSGLLFLLDEPTAGLHPADRGPLRARLRALVAEGNTLVCVEHDPEVLREADHVVELGPGAGVLGGFVVAQGPAAEVLARGEAPLARALARRALARPRAGPRPEAFVRVRGARLRTLRDVDASFAVGGLTCVVGRSGAGKTTLVRDVLGPAARAVLLRAPFPRHLCDAVEGLEGFDRVRSSDGAPSRHPRATAGSVLGALAPLRDLFAATPEARARGFAPARFSAHVRGGRCEACHGLGERTVALRALPGTRVPCDACGGSRFRPETLAVRVKGLSIADVLALPVDRAADVFRDLPSAGGPLRAAADVGLGYVPLGEPTDRLSGGEALRLRLAAALGRPGRARTLYLLDEPCAGLHPDDVARLAKVLARLGSEGHAVVAVEHDVDLVRGADHVVELGPGPGEAGGRVTAQGTPAEVAATEGSMSAGWLG